jgi:hypothetical protein
VCERVIEWLSKRQVKRIIKRRRFILTKHFFSFFSFGVHSYLKLKILTLWSFSLYFGLLNIKSLVSTSQMKFWNTVMESNPLIVFREINFCCENYGKCVVVKAILALFLFTLCSTYSNPCAVKDKGRTFGKGNCLILYLIFNDLLPDLMNSNKEFKCESENSDNSICVHLICLCIS